MIHKFKTYGSIIFFSIFILCLTTHYAFSQESGEVFIGGKVIFRFQNDGKSDPMEKAFNVQSRIDALMGSSLKDSDVRLVKDGNLFKIFWGKNFITTVDPVQAKLNNSTAESLAKRWVGNFKKAVKKGVFYLKPDRIEMPIFSQIKVKARGVAQGEIVEEYNTGNVSVTIDQENGEISIKGNGLGKSKIVFRRGGARAVLYIKVLDMPADIPDKIETEVSGDPAPKDILQFAAGDACKHAIKLKPGAKMIIGKNIRVAMTLDKGKTGVAHVPVLIKGPDYFTINSEIKILIKNIGNGFKDSKLLMVSDRPEQFNTDGMLFKGKFDSDNPTRLLYYHMNSDKKERRFWVELKNPTNKTVKVMISGAMGGPDRWGVTVGHEATMRFLRAYNKGIGYIVQIPPRRSIALVDLRMAKDQVLCGYFHLRIREGEELEVYVKNSKKMDGVANGRKLPLLTEPFDPFKIHPKGIFKPAILEEDVELVIGKDDEAACVIGQAPWLIDPDTGEPNNGNYGVFYKFNLKLKNPTDEIKRIGFFLVPKGVLARGSFIIDGRVMETTLVRYPSRSLFAAVDVAPKSEKIITMLTTPEGGSYYPVEVIIRTIER
ncbi:MAG: hypothetical protein K8T10_01990 [Candidatus Eremiobacteraeota bacterium]|nr:hypothetical protein [Candidatus Eremiobacteraeota bacterium]